MAGVANEIETEAAARVGQAEARVNLLSSGSVGSSQGVSKEKALEMEAELEKTKSEAMKLANATIDQELCLLEVTSTLNQTRAALEDEIESKKLAESQVTKLKVELSMTGDTTSADTNHLIVSLAAEKHELEEKVRILSIQRRVL